MLSWSRMVNLFVSASDLRVKEHRYDMSTKISLFCSQFVAGHSHSNNRATACGHWHTQHGWRLITYFRMCMVQHYIEVFRLIIQTAINITIDNVHRGVKSCILKGSKETAIWLCLLTHNNNYFVHLWDVINVDDFPGEIATPIQTTGADLVKYYEVCKASFHFSNNNRSITSSLIILSPCPKDFHWTPIEMNVYIPVTSEHTEVPHLTDQLVGTAIIDQQEARFWR